MADLIEGKVARILNSRELVINRGTEAGVKLGMRFAVLDTAGEGIRDPETGESLGSVRKPKIQVEVSQVSARLAVARTYRSLRINVGGRGTAVGDIARLFAPPQFVDRYETLKADEANWEPLTEERSFVKVGDPVVEIAIDDEGEVGGIIADDSEKPALPTQEHLNEGSRPESGPQTD
jgi:hypothetical protein